MEFKATLHLPDPDFTIPMKADLAGREPEILRRWEEGRLYHRLQAARRDAPAFVLHDGPPYTNSPIHLGTAFNKVLKDFVLKSRALMGYRVPYVPGYDNHGLPIEQAVMKQLAEENVAPDPVTLRKRCREHAAKYIELQSEQFQRLGILGLWERPYQTMDFRYEAEVVRTFGRLVEAGQVYRGLRPVLWSPTSRTALADTEIVYQDHVSTSIFARFPFIESPNGWEGDVKAIYGIIWTTTPWTIPANLALAFHPMLEYDLVRVGEDHYLILSSLRESVLDTLGLEGEVVKTFLGATFEHSRFRHPLFERDSLGVLADYVTTEDGTGIVHTAPGHGREDFMTGAKYGLPVVCPVDERGVMTEEAGRFAGVSYRECDTVVVEALREANHLLHSAPYSHTYPYAERDGKPVIFRATEQWFVSIDENDLRERMLAEIPEIQWMPKSGGGRLTAMLSGRPDWCVSRQRPWGVGIPVVYGAESGTPVLDPDLIESIAQLMEREGSDGWAACDVSAVLPADYVHPLTGETTFRKEADVFDVWFDSGLTHLAVLEGRVEPAWKESLPADLYLEGSDQHRGWFNSSMIVCAAIHGHAPYQAVVTHGFVTDEQGRKMSKRLGNAIDPLEVCNDLGADVLRLWVASVDFTEDVPCGPNLLKAAGEQYRTVRNTMRFLLGNLKGYDPDSDRPANPLELDAWIVEQTDLLAVDVVEAYRSYEFRRALTGISDFCIKKLSAIYLDAIKDRVYCDGEAWPTRRSAQWACLEVLERLVRLATPILPFTCEETYLRMPGSREESVLIETFWLPSDETRREIAGSAREVRFERLWALRAGVFALFEEWKKGSDVRDGQDVVARVTDSAEVITFLSSFEPTELANLMKFSGVELSEGEPRVEFERSPYEKCERSKLRRPDVAQVNGHWLTERDRKVLGW